MTNPNEDIPEPEQDTEIALTWIRDHPGLTAYAPVPASGRFPRDSRNRPRPRNARLRRADPDLPPTRPPGLLSDGDWAWIIRTEHTWSSFAARFGDQAYPIAVALAQAGCITIGHNLNGSSLVQPPRRVYPHPDLAAGENERRNRRRDNRTALQNQAVELASMIVDDWPGVAQALHGTDNPERLGWAINAALDLADGRIHDSVRAFVQHHAGHTKARDDVHHLLADMGFEPEALSALGLARSPYIGLGGPIQLHSAGGFLDLSVLPGPHDIRLSPHHQLRLKLPDNAESLLVIENRQAAETICDIRPSQPVVWCHGQPPDAVLALIVQAAHQATVTIICTDADLGGVRIAARIHDELPAGTAVHVVDVGAAEHDAGRLFNTHSRVRLQQLAARTDQIGTFAQHCLDRGYPIEQEATARAALREALSSVNR
ncbi:DUF2399 domain-containing protein [Actinoplanes sp. CA-030573]|uniref:DUF2399 domain-containing protein n=1 Tax=Actinoplanes sp. CA-030573 TaxID=3239898 RepID=UPI003D8A011D